MSTPKGMKCLPRTLVTGDKVLLYSDTDRLVLQLRHQVPTEERLLEPSFKVAVTLSPSEAITLASDLLNIALPQLALLRESVEAPLESDPDEELGDQ